MIVGKGLGSSLLITQGYGRKYLNPFTRTRDFKRSFYKFVKENYADLHNYGVFYEDVFANPHLYDVWLYIHFSDINVETGKKSVANVEIITRLDSTDDYNTQLLTISDELRSLFVDAVIDLYDFTYPEYPQKILDDWILAIDDSGRAIPERLVELNSQEFKSILQVAQISVLVKLMSKFSKGRVV